MVVLAHMLCECVLPVASAYCCCSHPACFCLLATCTCRVYFHLLMTRTEELLPYIYTPTVGEACETYHELPLLTQVCSV
jgi:hypothetical protein